MKNKLISRISNGFGNQMFLYAASYVFAKKANYDLFLDIYTGINHDIKKNNYKDFKHYVPKYELDVFNLSSNILNHNLSFDSKLGYIKRKIYIFLDIFKKHKKFIIEKTNKENKNFFTDIDKSYFLNT